MRLIIASPNRDAYSETFIHAHLNRLPFQILPIYGSGLRYTDPAGDSLPPPAPAPGRAARLVSRLHRLLKNDQPPAPPHRAMAEWFRQQQADALLAEFGPVGVDLMEAARAADLPLFVHFHGYDAAHQPTLHTHRHTYPLLFEQAQALFVVSTPMKERLREMGAPEGKLVLNPCGVDPDRFTGAAPGEAPPHFLAVGRFTEKKAPHLTVLAFAEMARSHPEATLSMAGDGPLLGPTKRLAAALGVEDKVFFPGIQSPEQVRELMRRSRAFVQHSLTAEDGNMEGTPVAILEAQMSGLPVVSTFHAGIPDVVVHGETGLLCDEGDASRMARHMEELTARPSLAATLGCSARERALRFFSMDRHIQKLAEVLRARSGALV